MRRIPGAILILLFALPAWPEPIRVTGRFVLSGRVLDAERRPVGGARIALVEIRESGVGTNALVGRWSHEVDQTDEEGRFVLNEIDLGLGPGPWHLEVRAPGFRTAETSRLQISEDGETAPLEIILDRGAVLEGRVLDGNGQPVPRAMIDVVAPDSYRLPGPFHWTDDLGRYRIEGLGPGEYRVRAGGRGAGAEGKIVLGDSGTYRLDLRFPSGTLGLQSSSPSWSAPGISGGGTLPRGPSSGGNSASTLPSRRGTIQIIH